MKGSIGEEEEEGGLVMAYKVDTFVREVNLINYYYYYYYHYYYYYYYYHYYYQ